LEKISKFDGKVTTAPYQNSRSPLMRKTRWMKLVGQRRVGERNGETVSKIKKNSERPRERTRTLGRAYINVKEIRKKARRGI